MEKNSLNKHTHILGRGFSEPMVQYFPSLTVIFVIQLCDHKRVPILKLQPVQIHCTLKDSLEINRVISKTKFLSKAYIEKGILIYHLDIKVASYQDVLVGSKKINQKDYTKDIFLDYLNKAPFKDLCSKFNLEELRNKVRDKINAEIDEEWCKLDHIIADALSKEDNSNLQDFK